MQNDIDSAEMTLYQSLPLQASDAVSFTKLLCELPFESASIEPCTWAHPLRFRFTELSALDGSVIRSGRHGRFDGDMLALDDDCLPASSIAHELVRNRLLMLFIVDESSPAEPVCRILQLPGRRIAWNLKLALEVARSARFARQHRDELVLRGEVENYREAHCPVCHATLVLTGMPSSPQVYCAYCDSLMTFAADHALARYERPLRLCDDCGRFSRPQRFTVFYWYFLVIESGLRAKTAWRCPACMRRQAWTMLLGNLPFVIGVPGALWQLARAYLASNPSGPFRELESGNRNARAGKVTSALNAYRLVLERLGCSAGVKYNLAQVFMARGDRHRATEAMEHTLSDCANYDPAFEQLRRLYRQLGMQAELEELEAAWSATRGETSTSV
ncbi:tetratricopeptide repeat protein [Planctomicrobium piriforme]|uniref:Tetratricopeptide repeat-containing protein n=1 Tax=Planctomicrobium piriforme TaxID=1576369 RepID=A0A1I3L7D8_9PLAN|nr:hypothetical protein [Planctomicrobium piriforme]SFI80712.1 hypothetical protein SAMN05421753_112166 [Planctomicrobium piriforme]